MKDLRFGPIWNGDDSVEVPLPRTFTDADREALRKGYIGPHLLNDHLGEVLEAVASMRQGRKPANAARAMHGADQIRRMMSGLIDELMVSEMVSHAEAGNIMGVSKSTAQSRREAARAGEDAMSHDDWLFRYDIGERERGSDARTHYRDDTTVVNVSTGTTAIQSADSVTNRHIDI